MGLIIKKDTLTPYVENLKKRIPIKQELAIRRAFEVMKAGFGGASKLSNQAASEGYHIMGSGAVPVVTGRLRSSLLGYPLGDDDFHPEDVFERYEKKGSAVIGTWGTNVVYALKVELLSKLNAGFFTQNFVKNLPKAIEVIKAKLDPNDTEDLSITSSINKITQTGVRL